MGLAFSVPSSILKSMSLPPAQLLQELHIGTMFPAEAGFLLSK